MASSVSACLGIQVTWGRMAGVPSFCLANAELLHCCLAAGFQAGRAGLGWECAAGCVHFRAQMLQGKLYECGQVS